MSASRNRQEVHAHQAFQQQAQAMQGKDLSGRFTHIYETNLWGSDTSRSGQGSVLEQVSGIISQLPILLKNVGATSLLDAPCGDFAWMPSVDLRGVRYIGADIVPDLVARNQAKVARLGSERNDSAQETVRERSIYETKPDSAASYEFQLLDLTKDPLPTVDVVLCRDCLVHLSEEHIWDVIENLKRSGSTWLLTTTFPEHDGFNDIEDGDWRLLNLELAPFGFPTPEALLNEGCTEEDGHYSDKSLGLWRISELPTRP